MKTMMKNTIVIVIVINCSFFQRSNHTLTYMVVTVRILNSVISWEKLKMETISAKNSGQDRSSLLVIILFELVIVSFFISVGRVLFFREDLFFRESSILISSFSVCC